MKNIYKYITLQDYALSPTASGHNPAKVALTHFSEHSPTDQSPTKVQPSSNQGPTKLKPIKPWFQTGFRLVPQWQQQGSILIFNLLFDAGMI
jgi:hypothetical protein